MKTKLLSVTGAIILILLGVLLFTSPAIIERYDLSKYNELGDAINGLTSPIIGLISMFLLYMALTKQTEANTQHRMQVESDILNSLLLQIEKYIEQFYYSREVTRKDETRTVRDTGIEGIHNFAGSLQSKNVNNTWGLGIFYQAGMILLILRTIKQFESRLTKAKIDPVIRNIYKEKIELIKELVLKEPLHKMTACVATGKLKEDDVSKEIQGFINSYERDAKLRFLYS